MTAEDIKQILQAAAKDRQDAYRECVAWLARNAHAYKPECLAEMMAEKFLSED